jgi:hypothetical protein
MINLYEQIANQDALQGIWSYIADEEGIIFKHKDGDDDQKNDAKMSQDQEHAVNLIKEAHKLKSKGSIAQGLQILEQALSDPKVSEYLDDHIKIELQNKRLDSKAELLKWDEIAKDMTSNPLINQKMLKDIPFH